MNEETKQEKLAHLGTRKQLFQTQMQLLTVLLQQCESEIVALQGQPTVARGRPKGNGASATPLPAAQPAAATTQ